MKKKTLLTRREALITGATALGGLLIGGCTKPLPPTYGNLLRMGDNLTYLAHRALLPGQSLAKEYSWSDISSFPATGTVNPADSSKPTFNETYEKLMKTGFSDWRINVEGSVSNPQSFSLAELMKLPSRTQITRHTCEEGWTAIGQWTGVPLGHLLQLAGIKPSARFVNFFSFDGYTESIDLLDAFHPQTLLAYGMNGKQLTIPHGAPIRLRLEKQIGYKSLKYLEKIVVSDEFMDFGDTGWAWYVGI
jgi:DMSO/TMAO reductase YedYZ molybdopterin-dependent catalytic subunit